MQLPTGEIWFTWEQFETNWNQFETNWNQFGTNLRPIETPLQGCYDSPCSCQLGRIWFTSCANLNSETNWSQFETNRNHLRPIETNLRPITNWGQWLWSNLDQSEYVLFAISERRSQFDDSWDQGSFTVSKFEPDFNQVLPKSESFAQKWSFAHLVGIFRTSGWMCCWDPEPPGAT